MARNNYKSEKRRKELAKKKKKEEKLAKRKQKKQDDLPEGESGVDEFGDRESLPENPVDESADDSEE